LASNARIIADGGGGGGGAEAAAEAVNMLVQEKTVFTVYQSTTTEC